MFGNVRFGLPRGLLGLARGYAGKASFTSRDGFGARRDGTCSIPRSNAPAIDTASGRHEVHGVRVRGATGAVPVLPAGRLGGDSSGVIGVRCHGTSVADKKMTDRLVSVA